MHFQPVFTQATSRVYAVERRSVVSKQFHGDVPECEHWLADELRSQWAVHRASYPRRACACRRVKLLPISCCRAEERRKRGDGSNDLERWFLFSYFRIFTISWFHWVTPCCRWRSINTTIFFISFTIRLAKSAVYSCFYLFTYLLSVRSI